MTTVPARDLLNFGKVRRYHTVPDEGRGQTTAEHAWGVAVLIATYHPSPSPDLLKAALFHDLAEAYVGDTPATAKWFWGALHNALEQAEREVNEDYGWRIELTISEQQWLAACDMLELYLYAQYRAGYTRTSPLPKGKYPGGQNWADIAIRGIEYINDLRKDGKFPKELEDVL